MNQSQTKGINYEKVNKHPMRTTTPARHLPKLGRPSRHQQSRRRNPSRRTNGIGQAKAEAIVTYRDNLGPFLTVDDLVLVKGIGEGTVEKNRALLLVSVDKEEK